MAAAIHTQGARSLASIRDPEARERPEEGAEGERSPAQLEAAKLLGNLSAGGAAGTGGRRESVKSVTRKAGEDDHEP